MKPYMKRQHTRTLDPSRARILPSDNPKTIILQIPWAEGKYHQPGRKYIIAPDEDVLPQDSEDSAATHENGEGTPSLRRALARAFLWREEIESGKCAGIRALACKYKLNESYVLRQIHLTFLAPSIVERVLK